MPVVSGFQLFHSQKDKQYIDDHRHLVGTCPSIITCALNATAKYLERCFDVTDHDLKFLREVCHTTDGEYNIAVNENSKLLNQARSTDGNTFLPAVESDYHPVKAYYECWRFALGMRKYE
ncbi:hypothetical protein EA472_21555 [Natrarchaeobius oligotrophus]|uniref:Uncharacterized protein n=2 Tax=Natrarchaeobius TaxID=2501796 RepID=A0A3N6MFU4_NATCH|nr:hypothetical protein EA472_21555 [Natrarchaeobius chitinivorans]